MRLKRSRIQWECDRRAETVPNGTVMGVVTVSLPAELKAWLSDECHRRDIPVSWLITEVLGLGRETYNLIGPPRLGLEETAYQQYEQLRAETERKRAKKQQETEHMLGDGPSTRGRVNYD